MAQVYLTFKNTILLLFSSRLVDCFHSPRKQWVQLEENVIPYKHGWHTVPPFVTQQFYSAWNIILSRSDLSHRQSPFTPLFENPATNMDSFLIWQKHDCPRLIGGYLRHMILSLLTLCLLSFLSPIGNKGALSQKKTFFNVFLLQSHPPSY